MIRFLSTIACVLALTLSGWVGPAKADEAARQVISDQLDAFQQDDFETAFTYASPMIKRLFGNSQNFGNMVRNGYPMVWRPAEVEFLEAEPQGEGLRQNVLIRDSEGVYFELEYEMIPGEDGWKINGVQVKRANEGLA